MGGPPANAILDATLRPVSDAVKVRFLANDVLLLGVNEYFATARKTYRDVG